MKAHTTIAIVGTLMLAATPLASHAGSNQAINACVKSFVDTYIPKDRVVRVHKHQPTLGPLGIHNERKGSYTIALSARGARSGKEIAQARCIASARGEVIVIDTPATDAYVADADFTVAVTR
jgi:hypothetical protein